MFTVTLSPGAIFIVGFAIGLIAGAVSLAVLALCTNKKKK